MKKHLLLLLMVLLCSTAATAATYYGFKIGDVQVTSDNYTNVTGDNITGSVKYDPSTSTVTLTNVTISLTGSYKRAIINESHSGKLIVKLVGSNTLRAADAAGVRLSSGTSMAIYMTEGSNTVIQSIDEEGIWVTSNSNYSLEIYGTGSLAVKSNSKAAIASDNSAILRICGNVYCSGAKGAIDWKHQVTFYSGSSSPCVARLAATNNSSYPVIKAGTISFLDGSTSIVRPSGAKVNAAGTQIVTSSGSTIYNEDIVVTTNGILTIDEINFPDANFRAYMHSLYPKGYMTQAEVNNLTSLNVANKSIANMKGIEKLTALKELHCDSNSFTSLDLSSNTALTYLDCAPNSNLTSLYVQGCTALRYLDCYKNKITDAGMTTLVNSLPTCSASSKGTFRVLFNTSENNVFTSAHAATAAAKNRIPYRYNGSRWVVISASMRGDVNGDGQVSIDDVTDLIDMLLSGNTSTSSDVNGDGQVSIDDVTALIDFLLSGSW